MKNKDLRKISKSISKSITQSMDNAKKIRSRGIDKLSTISESDDSYKWNKENPDVSKKIRNILFRILEFNNKLEISINTSTITISSSSHKELKKASKTLSGYDDGEDYFAVRIFKDKGFKSTFNGEHSFFLDKTLFNEVESAVCESYNKSNIENFNGFYNQFMKETGLLRDSNLDTLLD